MTEYSLEEAKKVWLISDTHFDHTNIIKYCNRPFVSTKEMNECMVWNWCRAIASSDLVYFLGDMAFGRESRKPGWWVTQLSGKIVWIKGSHDRGVQTTQDVGSLRNVPVMYSVERVVKYEVISCGGIEFMLVHDTFDAVVNGWNGWMIHGHNHDNRPHVDNRFGHKRINVSVEVIDYTPISLAKIVEEVRKSENVVYA